MPTSSFPSSLPLMLLVTQVAVVIGGVEYGSPIQSHCLVATPLKMQNIIKQGRLLDLSAVRVFALDEVRQQAPDCSRASPPYLSPTLSRPPRLVG